jgi:hypothetical protein
MPFFSKDCRAPLTPCSLSIYCLQRCLHKPWLLTQQDYCEDTFGSVRNAAGVS